MRVILTLSDIYRDVFLHLCYAVMLTLHYVAAILLLAAEHTRERKDVCFFATHIGRRHNNAMIASSTYHPTALGAEDNMFLPHPASPASLTHFSFRRTPRKMNVECGFIYGNFPG